MFLPTTDQHRCSTLYKLYRIQHSPATKPSERHYFLCDFSDPEYAVLQLSTPAAQYLFLLTTTTNATDVMQLPTIDGRQDVGI